MDRTRTSQSDGGPNPFGWLSDLARSLSGSDAPPPPLERPAHSGAEKPQDGRRGARESRMPFIANGAQFAYSLSGHRLVLSTEREGDVLETHVESSLLAPNPP